MKTSRNNNGGNKRIFTRFMQEKLAVTFLVTMLALFGLVVVLYQMIEENNEDYTQIVLLPYVLSYYGKSAWKKLAILADAVGINGRDDEEKAMAFITEIRRMEHELRIPETLPEIREEDIEELSGYADKEANPLYPVPMLMDAKELEVFYRMVAAEHRSTATA